MIEREPKHVTQIEIDVRLEDIDDSHLCMFCKELTTRVFTQAEWNYSKNNESAVVVCNIPGYQCDRHEEGLVETMDLQATIVAMEKAREIIKEAGDKRKATSLNASIKAFKLHRD